MGSLEANYWPTDSRVEEEVKDCSSYSPILLLFLNQWSKQDKVRQLYPLILFFNGKNVINCSVRSNNSSFFILFPFVDLIQQESKVYHPIMMLRETCWPTEETIKTFLHKSSWMKKLSSQTWCQSMSGEVLVLVLRQRTSCLIRVTSL